MIRSHIEQDLEDRALYNKQLSNAVESAIATFDAAITQSPESSKIALQEEVEAVNRLILSHLSIESDKRPGVMIVQHQEPIDPRFTGEAYERAYELSMVKTPAFAEEYADLVKSIGLFATLQQLHDQPEGLSEVMAIHNEMLQAVQFASWYKANFNPVLLLRAAIQDADGSKEQTVTAVHVVSDYMLFIDRMRYQSVSSSGHVWRGEDSIFAKFKEGEYELACSSLHSERNDLKTFLDTHFHVEKPEAIDDWGAFYKSLRTKIDNFIYSVWFVYRVEPALARAQAPPDTLWRSVGMHMEGYEKFVLQKLEAVQKTKLKL
uniref:Uncharacterized protein n=1 Tax=Hyaloperonospora arabidopsidis (strain Emoy2) TaxID=559515 RepID=M4BES3_HYAAE